MPAIKTQISVYSLFADYSKRVKTLVELGKYDQYDRAIIDQKIRTTRKGKAHLEAVLVYFVDRAIKDEDAIAELNKMDLRAGELHELLTFGAQHPEIQCQFPIVALGTIIQLDNVRGAPCLSGTRAGDFRQLSLTYCGGKCGGGHRFLAFRIVTEL